MAPKKNKKKEEQLPSFLLNLQSVSPDMNFPSKEMNWENYYGPLFFGCTQNHPPHFNPQGVLHSAQFTTISTEDILGGLFLPPPEPQEVKKKHKPIIHKWHLPKKEKKIDFEQPVRQYMGVRKVFEPERCLHVMDLGETESEIEGEACREVPICRVLSYTSISEQVDMVYLSDLRERNRPFMTYNERIAHSHFLKEFITVKVIGPKIPASITITKLPTKRKPLLDFNFQRPSKKDKKEEMPKVEVKEVTMEEENKEETKEDSIKELLKPRSMEEGMNEPLEDNETEASETALEEEEEEDGYGYGYGYDYDYDEVDMGEEEDQTMNNVEEIRKSIQSDKNELEEKEQTETDEKINKEEKGEEEGEKTENEEPTIEPEGE